MESSFDGLMEQCHRMKRPAMLPWVLFMLALAAGAATSLHLASRLRAVRSDAALAAAQTGQANDALRQELGELRAANAELDARLQTLDRQSTALLAWKGELEVKLATLAAPAAEPARSRVEPARHVRTKQPSELAGSKRPPPKTAKRQERG
jgi:hypothetical protein